MFAKKGEKDMLFFRRTDGLVITEDQIVSAAELVDGIIFPEEDGHNDAVRTYAGTCKGILEEAEPDMADVINWIYEGDLDAARNLYQHILEKCYAELKLDITTQVPCIVNGNTEIIQKSEIMKERMLQMLRWFGDDPTLEFLHSDLFDAYGPEDINRGYVTGTVYIGGKPTGLKRINTILNDIFGSEEEVLQLAQKDGIKIIPESEIPEKFPSEERNGWLDTPECRQMIQELCTNPKYRNLKIIF